MIVEEVRDAVYRRNQRCEAGLIDPNAGPCYDRWGAHIISTRVGWTQGEMDYVRLETHAGRHEDPRDHIWVCPGHHRGTGPSAGYQWATAHRREERDWLEDQYA
jgi:hypothetical protein